MKVLDKHALGMIYADYQGCTGMNCNDCPDDERCSFWDAVEILKEIDAEPVRHGRWIRGENKSAFPPKPSAIWYCSYCGERIQYNDSIGTYQKQKKKVNEVNPRCRRCGARMDGGD